jgi:cyclopropane fatty-acyl-phospholipid synthase-like methyltransferase
MNLESPKIDLDSGLQAGGAAIMWQRVLQEALPKMRELVPPGSQVLEVGYGDGLLTCFLVQELGWRVLGLEIDPQAQQLAEHHARQYGLSDRIEFRCCTLEETAQQRGPYDAVFIKTVLYNSPDLEEYARWLDWILHVLKPGGAFINFKSGRANPLTQWYRRLRRRSYTDLCLYTGQVEALYDARFEIIERRYYGGWSQFLAPVPALYRIAARLEENLRPRYADNSFIISVIARRQG